MKKNLFTVPSLVLLTAMAVIFTSCNKPVSLTPTSSENVSQATTNIHGLGCNLLPKDQYNNIPFAKAPTMTLRAAAATVLTLDCPPVGDQGQQGSCTAWGTTYAARSISWHYKMGGSWSTATNIFSPAYVYNQTKVSDCISGAFTIDPLKLLQSEGVCRMNLMPYTDQDCSIMPNDVQKADAANFKILSYSRVGLTTDSIKSFLVANQPVIVAGPVTSDFDVLGYGAILTSYSGSSMGSHCYCVVGYDDSKQAFKFLNSWGTSWATAGYGYIGYDYIKSWWLEAYVVNDNTPLYPCYGAQGGGNGLKGSVFGLDPSWATGSEYCKATDGDTNTFFDYSQANGGYNGLDLWSAKLIGKIRYFPRAGWASRMTGGKFQGSNTSESSGYVDLYTIPSTPMQQWNSVTISSGTAYRWVRYLSPDGGYDNIAEMEFYPAQVTITASAGANGSISPSGSILVNANTFQTFTITPSSGYAVAVVTVDGISQGKITSYTFSNVTSNHTISATFAGDPCSGVIGGGNGLQGTTFGLTPPLAAGSEYCKATDGDINTFYDATQADSASTGLDLGTGAYIGKIRFYPRAGFASRMVGGKFQASMYGSNYGWVTLYTITTTPTIGWNEGTVSSFSGIPFRWVRYVAPVGGFGNIAEMEFHPVQYTITASAGSNGSISPSGTVTVNSGSSQSFTITPNSGYMVDAVTVDGSSQGSVTSYTFSNVTASHTISATFKIPTVFPDPNKWYKIATKANTSLCLDVTGGSYANNTAIELWTKSNVNQEFKFQSAGNGYYTITCRGNTSYSIDMNGNFANGETLKLWITDVNSVNQKFKLVALAGGYYRLETSNSSFSIDNWGAGGNGVKPALWTSDNNNVNQQWVITEVQ